MDNAIRKAETLIEALSYIRNFRDRLTVIKLGGSAMEDPEALRATLQDVVFMETVGMRPVLVHGGGAVGQHLGSFQYLGGERLGLIDREGQRVDLGRVGQVTRVDTALIQDF